MPDRWVNAVITYVVSLDVPIDATKEAKAAAAEAAEEALEVSGPFDVASFRFEDVEEGKPPLASGEEAGNGGTQRSITEIREWVTERRDHEYRNRPAPEHGNTVASGMTMGALETLDALTAYLNGDDDA